MPTDDKPDNLDTEFDHLITRLNADQADALAIELSASYVAGTKAVRNARLRPLQKQAIKRLSAEHFGYISEFNKHMGDQLKTRARELLSQEKGYAEIREEIIAYVQDIFEGSESVIIDRTGQTRKVIEVSKTGTLKEVEKVITKPYVTNTKAYADMLSRTATHAAFEEGRASEYQRMGFKKWRFTGPTDERTRSSHLVVLGNVYEYGTPQSDMALQLLHEPHCRHRAVVFFDDPELDTPAEFYEKEKEKAGLYWDDEKEKWAFKD